MQGSTASIVGNLDKGDYTIVSFQITSASQGFREAGAAAQQSPLSEEERQTYGEDVPQRNAAQDNNLIVVIEYTDATGLRRTIDKNVSIQSAAMSSDETQFNPRMSQQQSIWHNSTLIGTIALVVLLIGGFVYYKKSKSGKKVLARSSRVKKE